MPPTNQHPTTTWLKLTKWYQETTQMHEAPAPMPNVYEEIEDTDTPPEPTVIRRANSYSDFYRVVKEQLSKDARPRPKKIDKKSRAWEALFLPDSSNDVDAHEPSTFESFDEQLLDASQQQYLYASCASSHPFV
jgi:hypothetical protein